MQHCLTAEDPAFGVVLISAGREVGGGDIRSEVGALAHITECADFGDGPAGRTHPSTGNWQSTPTGLASPSPAGSPAPAKAAPPQKPTRRKR